MAKTKSFDRTVRRLCNKKITDPDCGILGEKFTVEQAIAAAVVKRAMQGTTDSVKLIREILGSEAECTDDKKQSEFCVNIRVVD